jgi:hypothetical protein
VIDIDRALARVPDYQRFLTVDEMYAKARQTARKHPGLAELRIVGRSTDGEEIPMVRIGDGPQSVLLFACPHPNEPIGAMLVQFLLDELIADAGLREGRSWYLLPCVDPDGTRLNEGWFAGPFTVRNYARNFYRPRSAEQVEWSFPIRYKDYSFDTPMPETRALMEAFEVARPEFVYSLHNAGFGGVYYYISHDLPEAYPAFRRLPEERYLFMSLGEPEMPWAQEFAPAVFKTSSVTEAYDYHEKYSPQPPATLIQGGASSFDFLRDRGEPITLVTELPYFQSPQVADLAPSGRTRREVILEGIERTAETAHTLKGILDEIAGEMTLDTRFYRAVISFATYYLNSLDGKRAWAEKAEGMERPATRAQEADELYVGTFYQLLISSMLRRAIDAQLRQGRSRVLERAGAALEGHLERWTERIERNLDYSPIPIKKLVEVQYGAMLAVLNTVNTPQ